MTSQGNKDPRDPRVVPPAVPTPPAGDTQAAGHGPIPPAPWPQGQAYPGYPGPAYPYPPLPPYGYSYPPQPPTGQPAPTAPAPVAPDGRDAGPALLPQPRPGVDFCLVGGLLRKLDDKGRFLLPKPYSQHVAGRREESYMISPGPDGAMILEPQGQWWSRFHRQCREADDREKRLDVRLQSYRSFPVQPDTQNRILIPKELKDLFGITDAVLLIGLSDRAEIWNPETFEQLLAEHRAPRQDYLNRFYG